MLIRSSIVVFPLLVFIFTIRKKKDSSQRMVNKMESVQSTTFVRQLSKTDLWQVRELALEIFPVTYQEIVEKEQIDYMMDMFYTPENLLKQFESGQVFLVIYTELKASGFASYTSLNENGIYKLNKIYVDNRLQGKGLGRSLLNEVFSLVKNAGGKSLQLNVNRFNKAVGFYKSMGFDLKKEELLDIGRGYFMDDFVMEKILQPEA
ncbi:MAG TPA: GNAT family N-acetyltransferase [Puia sp.]